MAHGPFALFRKHQKKLLAFFGVAIMIAFLLPSASVRFFGGGVNQGSRNSVVVQWNGGKLNENEMYALRSEHAVLVRFLATLIGTAESKGGTPNALGIVRDPQTGMILDPGISKNNSGRALLQTVLLSNRARQLGLIVDDQAIQHFLDQLSGGVLSRGEIQAIAQRALIDGMDEFRLFGALRRYLMVQKILVLNISGMRVVTPGENWDYFNRLQRKITAEIMPLPVGDFVSKIADPSDTEVKRLYEEYKDRVNDPDNPEPGFKRPARVSLKYLAADMHQFLAEAEGQVTDEQVQAYFDENRNEFKRKEPPPDTANDDTLEDDTGGTADTDGTGQSESDDTRAEDQATSESVTGSTDQDGVDADPRRVAPRPPLPESTDRTDPRQAVPRPPVPADDEGELSDHDTNVRKQNGQALVEDSFRNNNNVVAEAAAEIVVRGQNPDDGEVVGENDDDATAPRDNTVLDLDPTAAEQTAGDDNQSGDAPSDVDLDLDFGLDTDVTSAPEPDYGHYDLEEVADQIRRTLVIPVAKQKVDKSIKQSHRVLRKYFDTHRLWLANKAQGVETPEPDLPDFQQLADEHGFTAGSIPLASRHEIVSSHEIGRAQVIGGRNPRPLNEVVFGTDLLPFMPKHAGLYDINTETEKYYLVCKTGFEEERVPSLEEVRDEVILAWKTRKAIHEARQEAERIAKQLNDSRKNLSDVDADNTTEIGPFSWYTVINLTDYPMGQVFLTPVAGVEQVGNAFMQDVFSLAVGQAGPAINRTQSVVYVVQVLTEEPDATTRQKDFFDTLDVNGGSDPQLLRIAEIERRELQRNWYIQIEEELDVVWNRPPEPPAQFR